MRTIPPARPAVRTRSASSASVASKVPGANTLRTGGLVVVVVGAVDVGGGSLITGATDGVVAPVALDDPDEPHPASNAAAVTAEATIAAPRAARPMEKTAVSRGRRAISDRPGAR